jgi:hypothetical protein
MRGWLVIGVEGQRIGRVQDLLIDVDTGQTRFIDVALDRGNAVATGATCAVIPMEGLRADAVRPHLHVLHVASRELVHVPLLGQVPLDDNEESRLRRFFRCVRSPEAVEDFWQHRRRRQAASHTIGGAVDQQSQVA